jgi:molybdate transport system permease protein
LGSRPARRASGRRRPAERIAFTALFSLCLGLSLGFLAIPLVALFSEVPLEELPDLLTSPVVREALEVTARTNLVANLLIVGFGTPAAYLLATRHFRGRALLVTLVELPLVLPPAVAGISLLAAFGAGGLLGGELASAGIVLPFSEWAVVLAVTFVASPFYVRQAISAFEGVDRSLTDAARTLGAGPWRTFRRVALPLARSALVAGWVLAFARGIGEFGATIVFAGNVLGQTQTLTLAVYEQLEADFDVALAIGILLVLTSAAILVAYKLVAGWQDSTAKSRLGFGPST